MYFGGKLKNMNDNMPKSVFSCIRVALDWVVSSSTAGCFQPIGVRELKGTLLLLPGLVL